jgi:NAD-dependent DNA ligase
MRSLRYEHTVLVQAVTRGDGEMGAFFFFFFFFFDANIRTIRQIPPLRAGSPRL